MGVVATTAFRRWEHAVLDVVLLICTLPVSLPLGLAALVVNAAAFRSLRCALFLEERVGRCGEVSLMVKFRTMTSAPRAGEVVPGFGAGRAVRPGITGLARITRGYVGHDARGYARKHVLATLFPGTG